MGRTRTSLQETAICRFFLEQRLHYIILPIFRIVRCFFFRIFFREISNPARHRDRTSHPYRRVIKITGIPCRMPWAKGFSKTAIRPSLKQPDVQQPSPISSQPSRSLCFCPQDHPPSWGWTSPVLLFLPLYGIMNYRCHLWEMAEKYTDPYYSQVRRRENTVPGKKGVCWLCVEL